MKRGLKVFVLTFFALLGLGAGLLLFNPAALVVPVVNFYLDATGMRVTGLQSLKIGTTSSRASSLTLAGNSLLISIQDLRLDYRLAELLAGHLGAIDIAQLSLELLTPAKSGLIDSLAHGDRDRANAPTLTASLRSIDQLPIGEISIAALLWDFGDGQINAQLAVVTDPVAIAGSLFFTATPALKMDFDATRSGSMAITGKAILHSANTVILNSEFDLNILERSVDISANSTLYLAEIRKLPALKDLPATTALVTDSLRIASRMILDSPFDDPAIRELTLTLDNADSQLHLMHRTNTGSGELTLQLPIVVVGEPPAPLSGIEFSISALQFTGSWSDPNTEVHAESTLMNFALSCLSMASCSATSDWDSAFLTWKFGEFFGEELSLSGNLDLSYANGELRASAASLELAAPAIKTAALNASATLLLEDLNLRIGNSFDIGFSFASKQINPGIDGLLLRQPMVSGRVELNDGSLTTLVEIELNGQLKIGAAIQHYFYRNSGDVEVQLAVFDFATMAPLSASLEHSLVKGDIVAGTIAGQGNISWSQQDDKSWQLGGPVRFSLQNISGFYQDNFFVDLNTELFAEVTTPLGLRSIGSHRATIASVDVGLEVQNIEWQYRFDSASRQFGIGDASTELLGGSIVIPVFEYRTDRDQNEMVLVISNLDLASIVGLADYPGLVVEGLISGYLPLQLRNGKILIEAGLVAALKPGGTIRYTPANPIPSSNPSIQLVNDALSNYQFTTLNTDVFYDGNGDLRLAVQLQGTNPDMNNGQAINLNVNITDNIPTLIRSLRASRVIIDALEQSLGNQ